MDGYDVEELYYLYLQGCPIAKEYLIKYIYQQIAIILTHYYYGGLYRDEQEDYIQIIMMRICKSLNNYRPDKGMAVKSFISMLIESAIKSVVVKKRGRVIRERKKVYSLDDYCDKDQRLRYVDNISDNQDPNQYWLQQEWYQAIDAYILKQCSKFEQEVVKYHKMGLSNNDIAKKLKVDIRSIYNANYRIHRKLAKFKSI